jgi:hypothetical protein
LKTIITLEEKSDGDYIMELNIECISVVIYVKQNNIWIGKHGRESRRSLPKQTRWRLQSKSEHNYNYLLYNFPGTQDFIS